MTLTITLPPETEQRLRERAAQNGQSVERFVQQLVEREVGEANGHRVTAPPTPGAVSTLEEILAPFRQEVADSGMTDEELRDFFTEVRDEVRAEKRAPAVLAKDGPMTTPRAVFDCVIFLQGAARETGPAGACFRLMKEDRLTLCLSPPIFAEVSDVLTRPKTRQRFKT